MSDPNTPAGTGLTHIDADGRARMVDVSGKAVTTREATARGRITANNRNTLSVYESQGAYQTGVGYSYSGGNLNLITPVLTGDSGSINRITAGGALNLTGTGGPAAAGPAAFGAEIGLTGSSVAISSAVVLPSGIIEQQTVGESRARGLDLEAKAQVTQNLSLIGGYSYMESEVLRGSLYDGSSLKGNEFATAPKHSASLWSYYDVPATDVSVGLGARYVGSYYFDAANSGKSDGTTLFDAAFNYKIAKGTDLAVNLSNLLDEQHVVGSGTANFYNPGREITAKVSYKW